MSAPNILGEIMKASDFVVLAALTTLAPPTFAENFRIDLGYGNITPCSTLEWRNEPPFGIPVPTYRTSPQIVHAYADVSAPSVANIQNDVQQCAVQGAAAAGIAVIITSPAAAMPVFKGQFDSCMQGRTASYFSLSLLLGQGECQ